MASFVERTRSFKPLSDLFSVCFAAVVIPAFSTPNPMRGLLLREYPRATSTGDQAGDSQRLAVRQRRKSREPLTATNKGSAGSRRAKKRFSFAGGRSYAALSISSMSSRNAVMLFLTSDGAKRGCIVCWPGPRVSAQAVRT